MEFSQFIEWLFYGILSGSAIYLVNLIKGMKESIDELNISVAGTLEKTLWHEKALDRLEKRIDRLENL